MQTFGQRLRHARESAQLTQEQLGFDVGVSKASISAWENDRERPSFDNLPKLHAALQRSLDHLIVGDVTDAVQEEPAEWSALSDGAAQLETGTAPTSETDDPAKVVEAMSYCQTFLMQALAATIPTAAVDVLGAVDHKLPQDLREIGYIQVLRKTILGQLSRNSRLSRRAAISKAPPAPQHKQR